MNPLSLIKQGLLAAGRNFDRNAAGDLPTVMGTDFTPDARRRARSNAIMAIGQSLASGGQRPVAQGLREGQESMMQGWAAAQQMKQQRASQEELRRIQADMGQMPPEVGGDQTTGALMQKAEQYFRMGQRLSMVGRVDQSKPYFERAKLFQEQAAALAVKPAGPPVSGVDASGRSVFFQQMSDGSVRQVNGAFPAPKTQVVNLGGEQRVIDLSQPGQFLRNTQTPDSAASTNLGQARLDQDARQFNQTLPIQQQNANSQRTSSLASAQNAATAAARLDYDKTNGAAAKLGEAAVDKIAQVEQGLRQLDSLSQSISEKGSWMGPIVGRLNGTFGGVEAGQAFGMNDGAVLMSQIDLARQIIGKAVEGGVLRKEDEAKYAKILPTMADSPAVAQQKIAQIKYELASDLKIYADTQRANGRRVAQTPDVPRPGGGAPRITITPLGGK